MGSEQEQDQEQEQAAGTETPEFVTEKDVFTEKYDIGDLFS